MATCLNIQILSKTGLLKKDIEFFVADEWTPETEIHLMQSIYQLLSFIRPASKSINLNIEIEVADVEAVSLLIKKKLKQGCEINTQKLTVREIEIIGLIMEGYTNNQIAEKLFISYETVKSHRKHILIKTGAKNTAALINYYHHTFFDE